MQPILMLAIVGVAAVALGTGFLNNNIELWIQQFGVGSGDIETPIDHITVDFRIVQQEILDSAGDGTGVFENVIDACIFKTLTEVGDPTIDVKQSELTCKLTGHDENWIANDAIITEGTLCADSFPAGSHTILMGKAVDAAGNDCRTASIVDLTPMSVDVRAVGDVIVVAHADTYSAGEHTCTPPLVLDRTTNTCVTPIT